MKNKSRLIREKSREDGYEVDNYLPLDPNIKAINIILKDSMDTEVKAKLMEGVKALAFYNLSYSLEGEEATGEGKISSLKSYNLQYLNYSQLIFVYWFLFFSRKY